MTSSLTFACSFFRSASAPPRLAALRPPACCGDFIARPLYADKKAATSSSGVGPTGVTLAAPGPPALVEAAGAATGGPAVATRDGAKLRLPDAPSTPWAVARDDAGAGAGAEAIMSPERDLGVG